MRRLWLRVVASKYDSLLKKMEAERTGKLQALESSSEATALIVGFIAELKEKDDSHCRRLSEVKETS